MVIMKQEKTLALDRKLMNISTNVKTLIEMVERGIPCKEILRHIDTIQDQLKELKSVLFVRQIYECTSTIQNNPEVSVQLQELAKLRDLFGEKS